MKIDLSVNGEHYVLEASPLRRLLDILREDLRLTGTKEGCGEGECGACAVILNGNLVNSCLVPAIQLDGARVLTIEGLGSTERPDPVQQAFMDEGAIQCGFCIPGMVMATRALLDRHPNPTRKEIRMELAGNLCRCTGYERIIRAAESAAARRSTTTGLPDTPVIGTPASVVPTPAAFARSLATSEGTNQPQTSASAFLTGVATPSPSPGTSPSGSRYEPATTDMHPGTSPETQSGTSIDMHTGASDGLAFRPRELAEALAILTEHRERCTVIAGATDLLTMVKLGAPRPYILVDISEMPSLAGVAVVDGAIEIGATTTFASLLEDPVVAMHLPALREAASLFGAVAIRNRATLGGNLASASPAADAPPVLAALNATVLLVGLSGTREIPIGSFFSGYRSTARGPDEVIARVRIPIPPDGSKQAFYKIGTRRAQSISKVSLACHARQESDGRLREVRLAAGSVAPTLLVLSRTQAFLEGAKLTTGLIAEAARAATAEVSPIDDVRSTARYRNVVTGRLLSRFLTGLAGS